MGRQRVDMVWLEASGRRLFHVTTISPPSRPLEPTAFNLMDASTTGPQEAAT
jgi:hypothetical protein